MIYVRQYSGEPESSDDILKGDAVQSHDIRAIPRSGMESRGIPMGSRGQDWDYTQYTAVFRGLS